MMSGDMNSDSSSPAPSFAERERHAALRALRVLALLVLAAAYTLILGLAVTPVALAPDVTNCLVLLAVIAAPVALVIAVRRRHWSTWWWIGASCLVLAPVLAYLAVDDAALRHNVTLEEIAPAFPGAEKSYEVLTRYSKKNQLGRDFGRVPLRIHAKSPVIDSSKPAEWPKWLAEHRADIEADWAELAPVRAWWAELNAFDRIGDLMSTRSDAEIIAFAPVRRYAQVSTALAGLQAIDGHGDDAIATLLPLLQVSRKLEPSGRTLVRLMIARVIIKMSVETAAFILDTTAVSPASRARLLAAVSGGSGGEAGARRLLGVEYAFALGTALDMPLGDLVTEMAKSWGQDSFRDYLPQRLLNVIGPFAYNPRRTFNVYGDLMERLQELSARRELGRLTPVASEFIKTEGHPRFKNLIGTLIFPMGVPAFNKVTESYWKTEDLRTRLRDRLAQP